MKQLIAVIVLGVIGGNIVLNSSQYNKDHPLVYEAQAEAPREVLIETKVEWTEDRIKQEIDEQAKKYKVDPKVMHKVIKCESGYNPNALGDGGKSRGLVQIHSAYHEVSDEDAYDPQYAIEFLAKALSEGKGNLWSCYRK